MGKNLRDAEEIVEAWRDCCRAVAVMKGCSVRLAYLDLEAVFPTWHRRYHEAAQVVLAATGVED